MVFDLTDLLIAVVGAFTTIAVTLIGAKLKQTEKNKRLQAENEMRFQSAALDFAMFLESWADIQGEVSSLFKETNVSRFIIFRAFNGIEEYRWTTGVLQMRAEGDKPVSYVHYELDSDYKVRLLDLQKFGQLRLVVDELPESGIKEVYKAEGVSDSIWYFIDKRVLEDVGSAALTYCSFSTKTGDKLTEEEVTRCRLIVGRLKGAAMAFKD